MIFMLGTQGDKYIKFAVESVLLWQKIYKEKGIENYEESIGSCRHAE